MFPFTRRRKTKTNILATECAFYSAGSIPRSLHFWFTHVSLSVFTGDMWGSPEGPVALAASRQGLQMYSGDGARVTEGAGGRRDHRAWGGRQHSEKAWLLAFLLCTCCSTAWHALLFFGPGNSYSPFKAQPQPPSSAPGRVGSNSSGFAEPCAHPSWDRPPGMSFSRQGAPGVRDHDNTLPKAQPRAGSV